jgi:signal transduction histidine kinase
VRSRLALLVLATTGLMMIAFLIPLALLVRQVAEDRATVRATADVQGIATVVGTADQAAVRLTVERLAAESGRPVTVFLADGTVLGSRAAPTAAVQLAGRGQSLTASTEGGGREIVIAVQGRPEGTAVIRTVVLGLVVADRLARALVGPITALSEVSHRLANAELTARAVPAGPPELRDVAGALNHLAGRIQELLRTEREHVADLSHRLRTPLTVLRLEAESLSDPHEGARVTAAADALERAVSGVIRQARRRAEEGGAESGRCDAAAVVAERAEFWTALAEDTERDLTVELAPGPLPVGLAGEELAAAVDALLGNVFAHTPDGTAFAVHLEPARPAGALLVVADRGPGVPAGLVRRGESGGDSTGLGLDIARRAAQASGGRLEIEAGVPIGAVIMLHLGPPALTGP